MTKRKHLRLILADAIEKILGDSHELTVPNCLRYVKPNLSSFQVRKQTEISTDDWLTAIELVTMRKATPIDQPQPLIESRAKPVIVTDWKTHLQNRLDLNLKECNIPQSEYDLRIQHLEASSSREGFFRRLQQEASAGGT